MQIRCACNRPGGASWSEPARQRERPSRQATLEGTMRDFCSYPMAASPTGNDMCNYQASSSCRPLPALPTNACLRSERPLLGGCSVHAAQVYGNGGINKGYCSALYAKHDWPKGGLSGPWFTGKSQMHLHFNTGLANNLWLGHIMT